MTQTLSSSRGRSGDIVVFSHLRWTFVWQRPQHLLSRVAATARRTYFVEEPDVNPAARAVALRSEQHGAITRVWLEIPGERRHCGFGDGAATSYAARLRQFLSDQPTERRVAWLYTPMALPLIDAVGPSFVVYDVMDDLASFAHAPKELRRRQREAFECADIVFTGGRSLQRGVRPHRPDAHCFPSGVEPEHYAEASRLRGPHPRPAAGYVGVIDERLDLDLVARAAEQLPDWDIVLVGPVLKIDEASLPQAANIHYPGACAYEDLPRVLARFDVALMPFALNEATRSISPTKTLEYLAAGLPVVSTRVPDVVADYDAVVAFGDDATDFADACRAVIERDRPESDPRVKKLLQWNH